MWFLTKETVTKLMERHTNSDPVPDELICAWNTVAGNVMGMRTVFADTKSQKALREFYKFLDASTPEDLETFESMLTFFLYDRASTDISYSDMFSDQCKSGWFLDFLKSQLHNGTSDLKYRRELLFHWAVNEYEQKTEKTAVKSRHSPLCGLMAIFTNDKNLIKVIPYYRSVHDYICPAIDRLRQEDSCSF